MKYLKFALHKKYFDTGMGVLNYVKYAIAVFGLSSLNVKTTMILAFAFAIVSYFTGWYWCNSGLTDAENEINNRFNPFQREVRRKLIKRKA